MDVSMRSMLAAGVTALTASAIVCAPAIAAPVVSRSEISRPMQPSAAVHTLTRQEVSSALAEIKTFVPEVAATAVGGPTTLNAASNAVDAAYQFITYWTDYFALNLAPYVLQFLPFGGIISNQIYAIYPPIIDFTDSVVYDLVDPVLNDPLNPAVWANGISAVVYTGAASLLNVGINEVNLVINYFLSWLPPLPPIPPWTVSTVAAAKTLAATAQTAGPTAVPELATAALGSIEHVAQTATTLVDTVTTDLTATATAVKDAVEGQPPVPTSGAAAETDAAVPAVTKVAQPRIEAAATAKAAAGATKDANKSGKSQAKAGKHTQNKTKAAHANQGAE